MLNYILTTQELMERAKAVLDGIEKGWLKLRIDHTFPFEKAPEAHRKLENRQTSGKVVLTIT